MRRAALILGAGVAAGVAGLALWSLTTVDPGAPAPAPAPTAAVSPRDAAGPSAPTPRPTRSAPVPPHAPGAVAVPMPEHVPGTIALDAPVAHDALRQARAAHAEAHARWAEGVDPATAAAVQSITDTAHDGVAHLIDDVAAGRRPLDAGGFRRAMKRLQAEASQALIAELGLDGRHDYETTTGFGRREWVPPEAVHP